MNEEEATDDAASGPNAAGETWAARTLSRLLGAMPERRDDAVAIVNGLFGDSLDERDSPLAMPMTIRAGRTELPLDRGALADVLADSDERVTGRLCVFVHGLVSTESIWQFPGEPTTTYGSLLGADEDVTVLSLRYNTGLRIATNGRLLAQLLDDLVRAWPVRVREIDLIGHSMGGLVVRSACHVGRRVPHRRRPWPFGRRWISRVRRIVLIGVPNTGAGLEAFATVLSDRLASLPLSVTRSIGRGLDRRSAGIKDLRLGTIVDEGSASRGGQTTRTLRRARYLVIAGSVTADPDHPVARVLGDALVTSSSATGVDEDVELFPGATIRMFPKVTHNALAHHPDIYRAIADWW